MRKRGYMELSFGMIFSIILIVVFLAFAFYVILKFLNLGDSATIGNFIDSFESDIDKAWKSSQSSQKVSYNLPKKIKLICFVDYSKQKKGPKKDIYQELNQGFYGDENMFFYPVGSAEGMDSKLIKHIDIANITLNENPFCIDNVKGTVLMTIKKNYEEASVTITR